jgi:hypothetical protein
MFVAFCLAPLSACDSRMQAVEQVVESERDESAPRPALPIEDEAPEDEPPPPPPDIDLPPPPPQVILPELIIDTPANDGGISPPPLGRPDDPDQPGPRVVRGTGSTNSNSRDVTISAMPDALDDLSGAKSVPDTRSGRFAYGVPSVMIVGEPYFLSVTIAAPAPGETKPQLDLRLAQDTRESLGADSQAAIRPGDVTLSAHMSAELSGDGFDVTALSEPRQSIDLAGGVTRWLWEVRGTAEGRSSLVMRLTTLGEDGAEIKTARLVPSVIDVRSEADAFLTRDQMAARTAPAEPDMRSGTSSLAPTRRGTDMTAPARTSPASAGGCRSTGPENRKLALVIGNDAYTGIDPLTYARADSEIVRDVLVESGFRVMHCEDLDANQLPAALASFREIVKAASTTGETSVAFYYSGHGASTPSQNETYLLPVSLRQATVGQIEAHGLSVGQVIGGLSNAGARRLIVIVDACRDVLQMEEGDYRGFRVLNWRTSAYDIVAYATMWGEKARDNGLYAKSLATSIRAMPGADIAEVLNRVQTEISNATREDQVPQYNDRMPGVFTFRN